VSEERGTTVTTTPQAPARLLSAKQVADRLSVRTERVRELAREGQLRSIRLTPLGNHRFRPEDVKRLLAGEDGPP
jgi:excisionase family DNA binding protein